MDGSRGLALTVSSCILGLPISCVSRVGVRRRETWFGKDTCKGYAASGIHKIFQKKEYGGALHRERGHPAGWLPPPNGHAMLSTETSPPALNDPVKSEGKVDAKKNFEVSCVL